MRVTAEEGYLKKLKDVGSIFVGRYGDHVQTYLSHRDKSHRRKKTSYPSSKMNRRDELSRYLFQSSSLSHSCEGGPHVFPIYQVTLQMADSLPEDESDD